MKNESVNHPKHYSNGYTTEVECNMFKRVLPLGLSDAFKYVWRAGIKPDNPESQDLSKALWYLDDIRELYYICDTVSDNMYIRNLINFLPKSSLPLWKYYTLRCILEGNVEKAYGYIETQLRKLTAHNNRP